VESAVAFPGLSINGFTNSSSAGIVFVTLKPFAERKSASCRRAPSPAPSTSSTRHPGSLHRRLPAAAGDGPGHLGGFKMQIEDRGSVGYAELDKAAKAFMAAAARRRSWARCSPATRSTCPARRGPGPHQGQAAGRGVTDVFDTLQIYLGSST
jgi:multidrug efflux pump